MGSNRWAAVWADVKHGLLAFDAWLDSSAFASGRRTSRAYASFSAFMERFHVSGLRRLAVELTCEGLTLGLGAALVASMLAKPAVEATTDDWLKKQDLAVTFLDRNGVMVGRRGILHDDSLRLEQLPPYLLEAVLSTEDRRFYEHFGIDILGTMRALVVNTRSSNVMQGGSSITQQLAKNLFLSNERTIDRKIKEAFLAMWLEGHLTKRQILSLYLDRVYMGGGTFGIEAAAQFYFGKSARDVTLAEAAMLAGLFKAPTKYAPHVNLPAARARAGDVLNNLVDAGYMTPAQIYPARKNPATAIDRKEEATPDYYLDWAYDQVKKLGEEGKLGGNRVLTVKTGLDINLQRKAENTLETVLREEGPAYNVKQGALVVLDPDGAVRAMVGGRDYGASQFNRATEAKRSPGSTFKPFVYLTALMSGRFKPNTIVVDAPICILTYCPHNFKNKYYGAVPLSTALALSLNTIAIKLSIALGDDGKAVGIATQAKHGRAKIVETARKMGVTSPLEDSSALPIGADSVTVLEMGSAYTTFAGGGKHAPSHAVVEIRSGGNVVYRADRDPDRMLSQVIDPVTIATMDGMLINDVEAGTGAAARLPGVKVGGKTGTTNAFRDAWFVGFTGNYVGAVWLGNDDYQSTKDLTGGALSAKIWHNIMAYAHTGIPIKPIPGVPSAPGSPPVPELAVLSGAAGADQDARQPERTLSAKSIEVITGIGDLMHSASRKRSAELRSLSFAARGGASDGERLVPISGRADE